MQADANESFEKALAPQPTKRKRSSILKPPDKRVSRDSRTVSFSDKFYYKELYKDGTCDITNFFLSEDMDISEMDMVDPALDRTINQSVDMSLDEGNGDIYNNGKYADLTIDRDRTAMTHERTLDEDDMIDETLTQQQLQQRSQIEQSSHHLHVSHLQNQQNLEEQRQQQQHQHQHQLEPQLHLHTSLQQQQQQQQQLQQQQQQQHLIHPQQPTDSRQTTQQEQDDEEDTQNDQPEPENHEESEQEEQEQEQEQPDVCSASTSPERTSTSMTRISDISSLNVSSLTDHFANDTMFGAFHDSNNLSILSNRTSGVDTLMHNIEALNDCIQKTDDEMEENRRRLDAEIDELFKFYRHIVNRQDKYDIAVAIFGLRHALWLCIKINPDTYPNEKLHLRFAFNRKDRELYPFKEYAEAVRHCTKEGSPGYLTRYIINAQRFRRFLRKIGYRKVNN